MTTTRPALLLSMGGLALALFALSAGLANPAHALDAESGAVPLQASCGDGRCSPPEDCHSCEADCGDCCGDHHCAPPEDRDSCPRDCN